MALRITHRDVDGVAVVALDGRVVLGEETSRLREKVKSLITSGNKKLVLNVGSVTLIDSEGLSVLVASNCSAKSAGASLRLCNIGSRFHEMLQITRLYTIFEVSGTEEDAVRALAKTASAD